MTKSVFFFDVSNPRFLPVLIELSNRGFKCQLSEPKLVTLLQEAGHPATNWLQFSTAETAQRIRAGVDAVFEKLNRALKGSDAERVFPEVEGRSFLTSAGVEFVADMGRYIPSEIDAIETFKSLCEAEAPDLVVMGGDNSHRQRVLIQACRRQGIPTLCLMHATFAQTLQARYPANQTHLYADFVAAYGERPKTDMIALGYPPERIFTPGAPLWDHLYELRGRFSPLEARRHFAVADVELPRILFCACYAEATSAFYPLLTRRMMEMHRSLARSLAHHGDSVRVVIRPHPMDIQREQIPEEIIAARIEAYQNWLQVIGFRNVEVSFGALEEDALCADVVVGTNGSSLLPLVRILERPVVAYRWYEEESRTFTDVDGVYLAERDCDLGYMIDELLRSKTLRDQTQAQAESRLHENNMGHDGQAYMRLAELVSDLIDSARPQFQESSDFNLMRS